MKESQDKKPSRGEFLNIWEYNFVFSLLILLFMATILDLGVSLEEILKIISK